MRGSASDLASGLGEPTDEERLVARMSLLEDASGDEKSITMALSQALRWGRPMDVKTLNKEREQLPKDLASLSEKVMEWPQAVDLLSRLYRGFTYPEIAALADPERNLPATIRDSIDEQTRFLVAKVIETATTVADESCQLIFPPPPPPGKSTHSDTGWGSHINNP